MRARFGALLLLLGPVLASGEDEITFSPHRNFKIVQSQSQSSDSFYYWSERLEFEDSKIKDVPFETRISWPALFYISLDEHWILRIQKSGSGDNISWLYFLEKNGSVWRMEQQLGGLGFVYIEKNRPVLPENLYHTGIEFSSWDMKKHELHFTIHGSGEQSGTGVHVSLTYELLKNEVTEP